MAPILLLANESIEPKLLSQFQTDSSHIFYLNDLRKCIEMVNSLPSSTNLVINLISDLLELENPLVDGLLALLLSLETFIEDFRFNWIQPQVNFNFSLSTWEDAFPFINFSSNCLQLPQIGQIQIHSPLLFPIKFTPTSSFKIIRKEKIKGFLSTEKIATMTPNLPAKLQVNLESDGIIFELAHTDGGMALIFLDPLEQTISFIEPVYVSYIKKLFTTVKRNAIPSAVTDDQPASITNKWLDRSFSLTDWTNENSIDQDTLKKNNKLKLKKLILLSLRGMGIKKSDKNFIDIWKHLYCGCIFSLRKELSAVEIDQNVLLKTIKDNVKFLNL